MNRKLGLAWALLLLASLPLYGQDTGEIERETPVEAGSPQEGDGFEMEAAPGTEFSGDALSTAEQVYDMPGEAAAVDPVIAGIQRAYQEAAESPGDGDGVTGAEGGPDDISFYRQSLQAVAVLLLICALVVLSGYIMRRFGKGSPLLAGPSLGHELGRIYLNPKASLHFVRSGGRVLVVGVTPQSMNLVTEFDEAAFEEGDRAKPAPATIRPFASELNRSASRMESRGVDDEDFDALRGDIKRLQQYLQDSARENQ